MKYTLGKRLMSFGWRLGHGWGISISICQTQMTGVCLFFSCFFCMFASISCLIKSSGDLCLEQPFKVPKAEFKKIKNNMDFQSRNQCPELNGLSPSNLWWFLSAAVLIWLSRGGYWVTVRLMQKQMRTQLLASVKWKTTDCTLRLIYTKQLYQEFFWHFRHFTRSQIWKKKTFFFLLVHRFTPQSVQ